MAWLPGEGWEPSDAWKMGNEDPWACLYSDEEPDYYRDSWEEIWQKEDAKYMRQNPDVAVTGMVFGAVFSLIATVIMGFVGAGFALAEMIKYYRKDKESKKAV